MYGCVLTHSVINVSLCFSCLTPLCTWVTSSLVINLFSCDIKNVNLDKSSRLLKLGSVFHFLPVRGREKVLVKHQRQNYRIRF